MSLTQDFLPVAIAGGANVELQATYLADSTRTLGQQPGVAASAFNNKALRQANYVTSTLAQFISTQMTCDTLDNGVSAQFLAQLNAALQPLHPVVTQYLSSTGSYNMTYKFFLASANATLGATYTNNGVTFTVTATIAAGGILKATGNADPLLVAGTGAGTLTKTGGTGDATITFYAFRKPLYLRAIALGGGGGGGGGGAATHNNGGAGGTTTFGSTILSCTGGGGGIQGNGSPAATASPAGGIGSVTTSTTVFTVCVATGGAGQNYSNTTAGGGCGGDSKLGGGAPSGAYTAVGGSAVANSGGGGAGGGASTGQPNYSAGGGAGGGYAEALIYTPASTYAYSIGAAGTAGTGGGANGGVGGSGIVIIEEHYQ